MNHRFGPIFQTMGVLLRGTVSLDAAFDGSTPRSASILRGMAGLLCIGTLVLVLTAVLNSRAINDANANVAAVLRGGVSLYNNPGWLGRLLFPVYFVVLFAIWSAARYGLLSIFDQSGLTWTTVLSISVLGLVPLAASGVLQGIINNLFPVLPALSDSTLPLLRVYGAIAVTLCVFAWEGFLVVRGLSRAMAANHGKGVLVWLTPYIALILLFFTATLILSVFG